MKNHIRNSKLVLASFFLALCYILPFFTGQIREIGAMLCPMHIPVLLCGFLCGWPWGLAVGLIAPLLRALTLGMPPFFPTAVCMAAELGVYGLIAGLMYRLFPKRLPYIYCSLLTAMVTGRLVWGLAMLFSLGVQGLSFGFSAFFSAAIINSLPGIILQITFVPFIVRLVNIKSNLSNGK